MAYIGLTPQTKVLATSTQLISGNGADYEYTLNRGVSKAADVRVFVGNIAMVPEVDYTASGTQLLFSDIPGSGTNNISVSYAEKSVGISFILLVLLWVSRDFHIVPGWSYFFAPK